jgi:hypothetical protein
MLDSIDISYYHSMGFGQEFQPSTASSSRVVEESVLIWRATPASSLSLLPLGVNDPDSGFHRFVGDRSVLGGTAYSICVSR